MRNSKISGIIAKANTLLSKVIPQETSSNEASQKEAKLLCKVTSNKERLCSTVIHNKSTNFTRVFALASLAILFLAILPAAFAISEEVTLQGKLTNSDGQALSGDYTFLFELFDSNSGGAALWTEAHGLTVTNGFFAANLGSNNSTQYLTTSDFNAERWVQITVDGSTQVPRVKLNSQPSAFIAKKAMGIDLNAFMQFSDFNSWYASTFAPSFTGDTNVVNLGVSGTIFGGSALNVDGGINVTGGDSNFVNVGVSNNIYGLGMVTGAKFVSTAATSASGTNAVSFGLRTTASGNYSIAAGSCGIPSLCEATGIGSIAMGYTTDPGDGAGRFGARGNGSVAMGRLSSGGINPIPYYFEALGEGSIAMGFSNNGNIRSTGDGSIAMGYSDSDANLSATGIGSIALGYNVQSLAEASVTLGKNLTNYNANSVLVQDLNVLGGFVTGDINAINAVEGARFISSAATSAGGTNAVALGLLTTASGNQSSAMGNSTTATGNGSTSMGTGTIASGDHSTAMGLATIASGIGSFASGYTEGEGTPEASEDGSTVGGWNKNSTTEASGKGSITRGYSDIGTTTASGNGSIAGGLNLGTMIASGDGSIVGGANTNGTTTASGIASFASGFTDMGTITASGHGSFASGYNDFGGTLTASGNGSMAFGYLDMGGELLSGGNGAISLGYNTKAFGNGAVALGYDTNATGQGSFASGNGTIASGVSSTAMGDSTTASGTDSFAAGTWTTASGSYSTALGNATTASGSSSMAIGSFNAGDKGGIISRGVGAFASGYINGPGSAVLEASGSGSVAIGSMGPDPGETLFIQSVGAGSLAGGKSESNITSWGSGSLVWGYSDTNITALGTGAIALGYNVQSLAEASVTLGKNLTNYNANSVLVQDLNVLGSLSVTGDSNFLGDLMITGTSFATSHVDHTPGWEGSSQEALEQLLQVETGPDGKLVHSTLLEFTRVKLPYTKPGKESKVAGASGMRVQSMTMGVESVSTDAVEVDEATTGRDLGATITMLTEATKALNEKIEEAEPAQVTNEIESLKQENEALREENRLFKEEMCARDSSYSWCETGEEPLEEKPKDEKPPKEEPPVEESPVEEPPVEEPPVEECTVTCSTDGECDDADRNTLDVCNNDGGCDSSCTNLPVVFNARAIWSNLFGLLS